MRLLSVFVLLIVLFAYASVGGVIFHYIEIGHEDEVKVSLNSSIYEMIGSCLSYDDVVQLEKIKHDLFSAGVFVKADTTTVRYSFWDYRTSILASIDSLTLVGNPAFTARSLGGRIFSIFYILIGQFLFYVAYMLNGKIQFGILSRLWKFCRTSFCRSHLGIDKLMKYIVLAIFGLIAFLLIPAVIFSSIERWDYGRAFYFVIGSLLSIGFYDIPSLNPNLGLDEETMQWYRLAYGFWLLLTYLWFGGILLAYFVFVIEFLHTEAEVVGDEIVKDLHLPNGKKRPQIPAPAAIPYQYQGYNQQPIDMFYKGGVTNIVLP